jgi:succinoglycan biosynthesis protein ExoM
MGNFMKSVAICIATCNRNDMLVRCLKSLIPAFNNVADYKVLVVVVDNNDSPSAQQEALAFRNDFEIIYQWEPRPGIPFARNRCLDIALKNGADFIAFIDDDEWVERGWLSELLAAADQDSVDVVSGVVLQQFGNKQKVKRRLPSGTRRDRAETDNVIMKKWLAESLSFDEDFAQTGGSDTLFFRQAYEAGAVILASDSAIVYEEFPEERQNLTWRLQRHFRFGLMHCLTEKKIRNGRSRSFLLVRGVFLIPLGLFQLLLFLPIDYNKSLCGLDRVMRGLGSVSFFLGYKYNEYKRS